MSKSTFVSENDMEVLLFCQKLKKSLMTLESVLEEFMINCSNKNLTRKTMRSYEQTLKLFFKYLEEEFNILELEKVEESHVKEYLNFTRDRGK
jgi:integrase/recombinase XerD